jgi:hypothetical protein
MSLDNEKRITHVEKWLAYHTDDVENGDTLNYNPMYRLRKELYLLKLGLKVKDCHHGLLVNDKFILAVKRNKWCVKGKYKWYYYDTLDNFVRKYVLNET